MAGEASDFRFLYRTDKGRIDRAGWLRAAAPLALSFLATTAIMLAVLPWANRPLSERAFFDPAALAANTYIIAYAALTILTGISWVQRVVAAAGLPARAPNPAERAESVPGTSQIAG